MCYFMDVLPVTLKSALFTSCVEHGSDSLHVFGGHVVCKRGMMNRLCLQYHLKVSLAVLSVSTPCTCCFTLA